MKIAVVSSNRASMEAIRRILSDNSPPARSVSVREGQIEEVGSVADRERPDLIILDGLCHQPHELAALEGSSQRYPNMALIMICANASSELLISAMHHGVSDVLESPVIPDALRAAVTRVEQKLLQVVPPRQKAIVAAFIACKGGSGATFLAANLAYLLAAEYNKKVALLDLNLQFGDAFLFVSDRAPTMTLADVARHISRMDASFLAASMLHVLPNFSVLAAPDSLERAVDIRPEHVDALLKVAEAEYDCVILDIGRNLGTPSVKALDHADKIFPVLQLTLPFIRDAKRLLGTLESLGYGNEKIELIVNRFEKGGDIQLADVEQTLGRRISLAVPNSFKAVSASVNQGVPIAKIDSHNAVTRSLRNLAGRFLSGDSDKEGGWLAHLFSRA